MWGRQLSNPDFGNTKISNEQYVDTLLPPGVKHPNSLLQSVPLAFCHDVGGTHPLLRVILEKVEARLPHKGEKFDIHGIQVEIKDFGMGNCSFVFKLCGQQGQRATCNCIQCLERFGETVRVSTNPPLEEVSQQRI